MQALYSPAEKMAIDNFYAMAQIGSPETVRKGLEQLLKDYAVDEFIFTCDIYDPQKRLDNFSFLMDIKNHVPLARSQQVVLNT